MKRKLVIAAAAAVAIAGTGTVSAVAASADSARSASTSASTSASAVHRPGGDGVADHEDAREAKAAKTTAPEAAEAAAKAQPGTVTSVDLDRDRSGLVWDVDVVKGGATHELVLDAATAKVLGNHEDTDDDGDAVPAHLKVSAADAARKAAGHGTVTSVDLDADDDARAKSKPVWEVETTDGQGKEHELAVDPQSGKVTQPAGGEDDDEGESDGDD
jgi:uncharacterized membrane protein YkoI